MNQRLYFLLPDREHAVRIVSELVEQGFDRDSMHTLAGKGLDNRGLPDSGAHQRTDFAGRMEFWGWRSNLALFFLSALVLFFMILAGAGLWLLVPLGLMVVTFVLGERFTHLPNTHLAEFRDALKHGEILLMVDTPAERVNEVEQRVHKGHPEAVAGGASWNAPALNT